MYQDSTCQVAPPPKVKLPINLPVDGSLFVHLEGKSKREGSDSDQLRLDFKFSSNQRMLTFVLANNGKLPGPAKVYVTGVLEPIEIPSQVIYSPRETPSMSATRWLPLNDLPQSKDQKGLRAVISFSWTEGDFRYSAAWKSIEIPLDKPGKFKVKSLPFNPIVTQDLEEKFRNVCLPKVDENK